MQSLFRVNHRMRHLFRLVVVCFVLALSTGCGNTATNVPDDAAISEAEGTQVGNLVTVPELAPLAVEGYGIVAGLGQNGSSECPIDVLAYLKRFSRVMMPESREDPEKMIRSMDTSVVKVTGRIAPGTRKGGRFDVMVKPIQGSQTRSLAGGQLYTTELAALGRSLAGGQPVGMAAGPIFTDTLGDSSDERTGWVLGGGSASTDYALVIKLKKPDYRMASALRNRVIQRFGPGAAMTENEEVIVLSPPARFGDRQGDFVNLVKALYVSENDELNKRRTEIMLNRIVEGRDRETAEAALIGLGRTSAIEVAKLLASPEEDVRLRAARIMLSYGEYRALPTLRAIAYDTGSKRRAEAIQAVANWAPAEQTCGLLSGLVNDSDMEIRLQAEEELVRCGSPLVERENVGGRLFLDVVQSTGRPTIYVTRAAAPKIVVFGSQLSIPEGIFLTAADGSITLNGRADSRTITVIRNRRSGTGVVGQPLQAGRLVADIIRTLSSTPVVEGDKVILTGLSVPYSDTIDVLRSLCDKGYVNAQFIAGEMVQQPKAQ